MISLKPCFRSSSTMCSITGRFTMGTSGFGRFRVKGSSREPTPAARIMALIQALLLTVESANYVRNVIDLGVGELGVDWDREDFLCRPLGIREVARRMTERAVGLLQMKGEWIVHSGRDPIFLEECL